MLDNLFPKAAIAPTAAKTAPSQSVAIALGHVVEAFPTPEAVETLRTIIRDVRHAGIKQKLQRNLPGAERRLADRPEIALRMPLDRPLAKPQVTTLKRCLEAGLATGLDMTVDDWRARLATRPETRDLTCALVWTILDGQGGATSVLPIVERSRIVLHDMTGACVEPDSTCRVKLWHPLEATPDEREAWRDRIAAMRIKQPFKQVFREYYVVPGDEVTGNQTAMFSGHAIAARPFLGLARRERWSLSYQSLARSFGRFKAKLELADAIYPGSTGWTTILYLELSTALGSKPVQARLEDVPAVTMSEILRAVDLLVSTSAFALADEEREFHREIRVCRLVREPAGAMIDMRKQALERVLLDLPGFEDLAFDARHLRLGPYAIHLATGRVTRDGEPMTIDVPKPGKLAVGPWLPHDEKLLEAIAAAAMAIAQERKV